MKRILLLTLIFAIPSFMFGQVTKYEQGLEAAAKAASQVGTAVTEGMTAGATKALTDAAVSTTPIEAATANGPIYTGMNVGTNAYMQTPAIAAPAAKLPGMSRFQQNITDNVYRAAQRVGHFVRFNTIDLSKRWDTSLVFSVIKDHAMKGQSLDNSYLTWIVDLHRKKEIALSNKQKNYVNSFYTDFLDRTESFNGIYKFSNSLAAVTGLTYTGNEDTDNMLVRFAMKAPEEYAFLTDFVVIPVLRLHKQAGMIRDLANFRSVQEKWMEGGQGDTLPLYQVLQKYDGDFSDILPDNLQLDNIPPENRKTVDVTKGTIAEFCERSYLANDVLVEMQEYLKIYKGSLYGWEGNYRKLFFEKRKGEK